MILNQHCVVGRETALLPVCLVKDGFIPQNLKKVCLEVSGTAWVQTDHIHQYEKWEAQKVSVARVGPESKWESCQPQQYSGFHWWSQSPNLDQLGFSSLLSFQIVPGSDNTTFRQNGPQICPAGKPWVQSQALWQLLWGKINNVGF